MRANTHQSEADQPSIQNEERPSITQAVGAPPTSVGAPPASLNVPGRPYTGGAPSLSFAQSNDGVFANLNAKPERGEKLEEEQPPVSVANSTPDV